MRRNGERGETMYLVIGVMAVLAGLAWVIPMVFLGKAEVQHAADLTGASHHRNRTEAPTDPIGKANDASTEISLQTAIQAAAAYFTESGTYVGFDASQASAYDPSIHLTAGGPAQPGVISERGVTPTTIVLVTDDGSGGVMCAAANGAQVTYGRQDAASAAQCTGGF